MRAPAWYGPTGAVILVVFASGIPGCVPHRGMYGHQPERLWELPPEPVAVAVTACTSVRPVVMKRFEGAFAVPVGADFMDADPSANSMTQSYVPRGDLAASLFDATFDRVRQAGCRVWKDYDPNVHRVKGPPEVTDFDVMTGVVQELEVSTFEKPTLMEGARALVAVSVYGASGQVLRRFSTEAQVRITRGSGDVLEALGQRLAAALVRTMNAGW